MNKKSKALEIAEEIVILSAADLIIAAAVYFFLIPSKAAISSISGLSIVLSNVIPLRISAITLILNIVLLIIGFFACGGEFGIKTVYTTVLFSVYLALFEDIFPTFTSFTDSPELDVLCYILVVSVGLSILFNRNASSGGLDIVAKIMNIYLHIELGKAMTIAGTCVALTSAIFYDKKIVVLSLLGTYFNGMILDHFIFNRNIKRRVCIVSQKFEEIRKFIVEDLHSGASVYEMTGAYHMDKHLELITIVDKHEYQKLMAFLKKEDPSAFVTVYTVSDMHYIKKEGS
ncbi:MAG: YitT family protein [Lachnospiraceae bacterium]|nr:YitT family protein [Lachnospiraceae bacterium]